MIVLRKCELAKAINKRAKKTHQQKIVKIRMKNEDTQVKKSEKKKVNAFQIDNAWFNDDGSEYTESGSAAIEKVNNMMLYMEKIKQLQEELKQTKEVECFYEICSILLNITTNLSLFVCIRMQLQV